MVGRRKKPKKDDAQPRQAARQAGYRDWDNIVPGEAMAPQPYAEQSWQSTSQFPTQAQPQAAAPVAPPQPAAQPQQAYQQSMAQPQTYQQPAAQPQQYQQPPPSAQYQQPAQQPAPAPQYQQQAPAAVAAPGAAAAPASAVNPTDGNCIKCGAAFGQQAVCEGCGAGRTACQVCGTKIWAGALTCSAHSNATRR